MHITPQEEKIARLALDPAAESGEIASAANKLVCSWRSRDITVEQIRNQQIEIRTLYQDRDRIQIVKEVPLIHKVGLFCIAIALFFSLSTNCILIQTINALHPAQTEIGK
jgi:hypothetical protein